jgi:hypothetical protein
LCADDRRDVCGGGVVTDCELRRPFEREGEKVEPSLPKGKAL